MQAETTGQGPFSGCHRGLSAQVSVLFCNLPCLLLSKLTALCLRAQHFSSLGSTGSGRS